MKESSRLWRSAFVIAGLFSVGAIAACTGQIGGSQATGTGGSGVGPGSGAAGTGVPATGSAGSVGGPGAAGAGGAADPPPVPITGAGGTSVVPPVESAGTLLMRRLTYREYDHMLADLLGDTTAPAEGGNAWSPDAPNAVGYVAPNSVADLQVDLYNQTADATVDAAVKAVAAGKAAGKFVIPCKTAPTTTAAETTCATQFITSFGLAAYRRPIAAAEQTDLLALFTKVRGLGLGFNESLGAIAKGMIQSPSFLYHWEIGPTKPVVGSDGLAPLTSWQVASRLASSLWETIPDDTLLQAAQANQLNTADAVSAQVTRMLADPRAANGLFNFHQQWLFNFGSQGRDLSQPLTKSSAKFTAAAAQGIQTEFTQFISSVYTGDGTLEALFTAPYTFVNRDLGAIYGVTGPATGFAKVSLDPTQRGGIFTQTAFLATLASDGADNPVYRGLSIYLKVLCGIGRVAACQRPGGHVQGERDDAPVVRGPRQRGMRHRVPRSLRPARLRVRELRRHRRLSDHRGGSGRGRDRHLRDPGQRHAHFPERGGPLQAARQQRRGAGVHQSPVVSLPARAGGDHGGRGFDDGRPPEGLRHDGVLGARYVDDLHVVEGVPLSATLARGSAVASASVRTSAAEIPGSAVWLIVGMLCGAASCRRRDEPPAPAAVARPAVDAAAAIPVPAPPADVAPPRRAVRPRAPVEAWASWPMPNAPLPGLPNPHSYDRSIAGVVVDEVTGLMWQRSLPNKFFTFEDAERQCDRLTLAGHDDWRLPSRIELVSLLDTTRTQPSIDVEAFPRTPSDWFWTSSLAADDPNAAWYVYFYFGYPKTDDMTNRFSVRCVRPTKPKPASSARYEVRAQQVRDVATGLLWQRIAPSKAFQFEAALAYCGHLRLGGKKGWRVPSLGELLTLIDERAGAPMIDRTAFPKTPGEPFWSSSTFANGSDLAWYVRFDHGNGLYGRLVEPFRVRCVLDVPPAVHRGRSDPRKRR